MKRIVAFLLCVLLIGSVAGDVHWAQAAGEEPGIEIAGYTVQGVAGVADVYAVTLKLRRTNSNYLTGLKLSTPGLKFKQATGSGGSYTISNDPLSASQNTINTLNGNPNPDWPIASETFYFIRIDEGNDLLIHFFCNDKDPSGDASSDGTISVIKSAPDPIVVDPVVPGPPVEVDTTKYKPMLSVTSDAALPLLDQTTEELSIPITNTAIYSANKITVSMEPTDKDKPLFTANRISVSASINTLSRDQVKDAKFAVKLAPGAKTGIHQVTLKYSFNNNHGDHFNDDTETVYIQVENRNAAPRLTASCSKWLTPGEQAKVEFKLTNHGTTVARDVKVTLEGLSPTGVALINDIDVKHLDLIGGGESAGVYYNLLPAHALEGSSTSLQLKVDYSDSNGENYSDTNSVFLPLYGAKAEDKGVPRLIISKYSFAPQEIRAGSECILYLDLQNTSRSKTITNLKVTILSEEGIFLPVDASNTIFIESIAAGDVVAISLPMATKADAENKPYPLRISFDYEDSQGTAHSSQEMISVPVQQNSRLVVGDIALYGEPMLHEMVPVNVEFYNLGKTILYNLMVKAEGPFKLEGGRYFVGNFNPGASDSFNFAVTPTEPGEQIGAVIFQFEDSIGTQLEVRRELKLDVIEPFFPDEPGNDVPPPPQKASKWKYIGIGAGVLVVVVAGYFWWRRRRKKKRIDLQRTEDLTAATQAVVPEIEYVGFEDEAKPDNPEPKN